MTAEQTEDGEGDWTRPFADILVGLNRGKTHTEVSAAMRELVSAVEQTRKKGSLALTITVTPGKAEGVLEVSSALKLAPPKHDAAVSIFYSDAGNLVREDPNQQQLPLRDVSADPSDRPFRKDANA